MKSHVRNVLATIRIDTSPGRDVLSGVFSFIENGHPWKLKLVQEPVSFTPDTIREAETGGMDGYILSFGGVGETADCLCHSHIPAVFIGTQLQDLKGRNAPTSFVWNDNAAIGAAGAKYLATLGTFNSYAFVHSRNNGGYSEARRTSFAATLRKIGRTVFPTFKIIHPEGSYEDIVAMSEWLTSLPKPAAVMAASDRRALHVLAAADRAKLKIPGQVALIGVDNDEMLVSHSVPPLTSVQPGHFEMGFKAAAELERLMSGRRTASMHVVHIPPNRIVERESTSGVKPAAMLLERAKKFIRQRSSLGITVADVVAHLGCSRELADLRFKEIKGHTVRAEIEAYRMSEVKHLLKSTRRPVKAIAAQCGFKSACHLSHLFRHRFGCSIREWRKT